MIESLYYEYRAFKLLENHLIWYILRVSGIGSILNLSTVVYLIFGIKLDWPARLLLAY